MSGSAIPASQIVSIVPSVLNAGGTGLDLNGLLVMSDNHIPIGEVYSFPNLTAVQQFFGPTSYLSMLAGVYFLADINATKRPGALLMTCYYMSQWLPAWVYSKQLPTLSLAQLNAIQTSQFAITIDGVQHITTPISLSTSTSFSDAAFRIGAGIHNYQSGVQVGNMTVTCSGTTMTVTSNTAPGAPGATTQQQILPGDTIFASTWPVDTYVVQKLTGNGITGTFQLNKAHTQGTPQLIKLTRNCCSWDAATTQFKISTAPANQQTSKSSTIGYPVPISGNLLTVLGLTQAGGARIQPQGNSNIAGNGPLIGNAGAFMDGVTKVTMNWASFATAFDPDPIVGGVPGNTQKQAFASWANSMQNNYLYVCWDTDPVATSKPNATTSLGRILNTSLSSGTAPIYSPNITNGRNLAMFTMGVIAAIDFNRFNGRKTLAFRAQTGITPDITNGGVASNLEANFYNYYGIWTTANDLFPLPVSRQCLRPVQVDRQLHQPDLDEQRLPACADGTAHPNRLDPVQSGRLHADQGGVPGRDQRGGVLRCHPCRRDAFRGAEGRGQQHGRRANRRHPQYAGVLSASAGCEPAGARQSRQPAMHILVHGRRQRAAHQPCIGDGPVGRAGAALPRQPHSRK